MDTEMIIYLNGKYVNQSRAKISVFDQGVLLGDGIFEGLRAYSGRIFKCDDHIDRLYDAAKSIMLTIPLSKENLKSVIFETCKRNRVEDGYIRVVVTRGIGDLTLLPYKPTEPTVFCIAAHISLYPEEMYKKGIPLITATQRRNKATIIDPQIKSLNYLNNVLAKIEAFHAGVPEALMLTHDGIVAECTGDNIFIVKDGIICTPPVHVGILNGITRQTIIKLAGDMGIELHEKEFTLFNVYSADECFLTGTAAEIIPVREVDHRVIGSGQAGRITKTLVDAFHKYVKGNGSPIYEEQKGKID